MVRPKQLRRNEQVIDHWTGCKGWDGGMGRCFSSWGISFYSRAVEADLKLIHLHFLCKPWSLTLVGLSLSQPRRETPALWCTTTINGSEEAKPISSCQSPINTHSYTQPVTSQLRMPHLLCLYKTNPETHFNVFVCFVTLQRFSKSVLACRFINLCYTQSINHPVTITIHPKILHVPSWLW